MISAVQYSSSLVSSLLLSAMYLLIPLVVAIVVGTVLGLSLYLPRLYQQPTYKSKYTATVKLILSVITSFPFSFLFLTFVSLVSKPFSTSLPMGIPLLPLSIVACSFFALQVENLCTSTKSLEIEMTETLGLSKKAIVSHVLLPGVTENLLPFMVDTLLALLPALVIVGISSGLGLGGHFYLSWCNAQATPSLWLADLVIIIALLLTLLLSKKALQRQKHLS